MSHQSAQVLDFDQSREDLPVFVVEFEQCNSYGISTYDEVKIPSQDAISARNKFYKDHPDTPSMKYRISSLRQA